MKRVRISNILKKKGKVPITCLTAYSKTTAEIADKYCDIILVGDSVGMVLYGMQNTRSINLDTMILHAKTVKKFSKKSLVVFDMPYKSYLNKIVAYKNAKKIIKMTKCDAVKLEGGKKIAKIVNYLTQKKIPVMGHIGLLPQSAKKFRLKGKNSNESKKIYEDSLALSAAGVFAIVIECVVEELARKITNIVPVPTIGIGASKHCDGQILVIDDMLGLSDIRPKFVKQYSKIKKIMEMSVKKYSKDVKTRRFPYQQNIYR